MIIQRVREQVPIRPPDGFDSPCSLTLAGRLNQLVEGRALAGRLNQLVEGRALAGRFSRLVEGRALAGRFSRLVEGRAPAGRFSRLVEGRAPAGRLSRLVEGKCAPTDRSRGDVRDGSAARPGTFRGRFEHAVTLEA